MFSPSRASVLSSLCAGLLLIPSLSGSLALAGPPASPWPDHNRRQITLGPNPIDPGWYADPDIIRTSNGTYWIYATLSIAFNDQKAFDAFSSPDLVSWTKHPEVFTTALDSTWATSALWAPCVVERDGVFWFYYTANNPVANEQNAGIGVAKSASPEGPFTDVLPGPLVGTRMNGVGPMDQQVFLDDDGRWYLVWGGSGALIQPLGDDMASLVAWPDGSTDPKVITPTGGFTEGSFMLKRKGVYYFMWSEGGYGTPDYRVAYAMSDKITGPFERIGLILSKGDSSVADGPGHHSVVKAGEDEYYVAYHRRILGDTVADHRVLAVDRIEFNEDGTIKPVAMT